MPNLFGIRFLDAEQHPEKYKGINVGFDGFDKLTGGLVGGTVTLIIGGWKSAKSVLSMNMAHNVATSDFNTKRVGKRVLYHVNEGRFELNQARLSILCDGNQLYSFKQGIAWTLYLYPS